MELHQQKQQLHVGKTNDTENQNETSIPEDLRVSKDKLKFSISSKNLTDERWSSSQNYKL